MIGWQAIGCADMQHRTQRRGPARHAPERVADPGGRRPAGMRMSRVTDMPGSSTSRPGSWRAGGGGRANGTPPMNGMRRRL